MSMASDDNIINPDPQPPVLDKPKPFKPKHRPGYVWQSHYVNKHGTAITAHWRKKGSTGRPRKAKITLEESRTSRHRQEAARLAAQLDVPLAYLMGMQARSDEDGAFSWGTLFDKCSNAIAEAQTFLRREAK